MEIIVKSKLEVLFMKKKACVIVLAIVILVLFCLPLYARYSYITMLSGGLSIDSNGLATCSGLVIPSKSTTTTFLTVTLEHSKNGSWVEIESWTNSGSGLASISLTGKRYVARGTYRVVVNAKVYDTSSGELLEDVSYTTSKKTY